MPFVKLSQRLSFISKWIIQSRRLVILLNSLRKFLATLSVLNNRRFHPSSSYCSLFEFPSTPAVLTFYPQYLRILKVTSQLLIVLVDRERSHWVLAALPFIRALFPYSSQWVWGNVEVVYNIFGVWGILIHFSSTMHAPNYVQPPL